MLLNQQQLMQLRNQLLLLLELPQVGTLPLHAASVELDLQREKDLEASNTGKAQILNED